MTTLVRKHVSITSIQFVSNKHHCHHHRKFNRYLKHFDWLLHRPEYWLRLLFRLELKILTPDPSPA